MRHMVNCIFQPKVITTIISILNQQITLHIYHWKELIHSSLPVLPSHIFCITYFYRLHIVIQKRRATLSLGTQLLKYHIDNHLVPGSGWLNSSWRFKFVFSSNSRNRGVHIIPLELPHWGVSLRCILTRIDCTLLLGLTLPLIVGLLIQQKTSWICLLLSFVVLGQIRPP